MDQRLSNGGRWQLINPSLVRATVVQIKEEIRKRRTEDEVAANNPNSVTPLSAQTESVSEHTEPPQA